MIGKSLDEANCWRVSRIWWMNITWNYNRWCKIKRETHPIPHDTRHYQDLHQIESCWIYYPLIVGREWSNNPIFESTVYTILVGGFHPSETYWSVGMFIPNLYGKTNVPNHQPVYITHIYIWYNDYTLDGFLNCCRGNKLNKYNQPTVGTEGGNIFFLVITGELLRNKKTSLVYIYI